MDRLTEADLDRMRAVHVATPREQEPHCWGGCCGCFKDLAGDLGRPCFPCDAARLLAELDQRNTAVRAWQGRRHESPSPYLAGVAYGLMGPATNEELPHGA